MTRKTKVLTATATVVGALIAAVPWLVPLDRWIPDVEAQATRQLGEPVRIDSLRVYLLPRPHVTARGIRVGTAPMLDVGSLRLTPSLLHLFADVKLLSEVRLERVTITQELLRHLASLSRTQARTDAVKWRIQRVVLNSAELRLRTATLRNLYVEMSMRADGVPEEIQLNQDAGHLRAVARAEGKEAFRLEIAARDWKLPAGPALVFERLDATALLTSRSIISRDLVARLYGGRVAGPVAVSWKPDWIIASELSIDQVGLQPLAALLSRDHPVSGRLTANPRIVLRAHDAIDLPVNMQIESEFKIEDGVLHNIDLLAAVRNPFSKDAAKDGFTSFQELSGHLVVDREGYRFSRLKVASGLLGAEGEMTIGRDQRLSGRIDAELKGTASLLAMPLQITGTIQEPNVFPTKTAMAGAVAGSVLMPVIGTAAGIKAGQLVEKFLGQLDEPAAPRDSSPEVRQPRK